MGTLLPNFTGTSTPRLAMPAPALGGAMSVAFAVISPELLLLIRQAVREEMERCQGGATVSTEEAAAIANRDPKTVRRWLASGELPSTKRGRVHRIRRDDLARFLAGGRADAAVDAIVASLG